MTNILSLPSYKSITDALDKASIQFDAAQIHGLFCGLVCGETGAPEKDLWKQIVFDKKSKIPKDLSQLEQLYEISYHLLFQFSFEFNLVLPDDSEDINQRTEALGLWCQGFLAGLSQWHVPITNREPSDVTDALTDIVEIAQVGFGDIAKNDEEESAYFELAEHVRLNVLMIFQELKSESHEGDQSEENNLLH